MKKTIKEIITFDMKKCDECEKNKVVNLRKKYLEVEEKIYQSPIAVTLEEIKFYHRYKDESEIKTKEN